MIKRLRGIPDYPGAWGKFIVCVYLLGWAIAILLDAPATTQWPPIKLYTDAFGRNAFGFALLAGALLPIVATAVGNFWFRLTTTSYLLIVWCALLVSSCAHWQTFRPATLACAAGMIAAVNSIKKLVDRWGSDGGT